MITPLIVNVYYLILGKISVVLQTVNISLLQLMPPPPHPLYSQKPCVQRM